MSCRRSEDLKYVTEIFVAQEFLKLNVYVIILFKNTLKMSFFGYILLTGANKLKGI